MDEENYYPLEKHAKIKSHCARSVYDMYTSQESQRYDQDNGYVLDPVLGDVPDIRHLPRKGGCGIGPDGASFEQVLDKLDMTALQKREAQLAEERKKLEDRLKKQEAEVSRLRSLSEKDLLVEIVLLLQKTNQVKDETVYAKKKKSLDYAKWEQITNEFKEEQQVLSGIK